MPVDKFKKELLDSFDEVLEDQTLKDVWKREEVMATQERINSVYETANDILIKWVDTEIKRYSEFDKDDLVKIVVCARLNFLPEALEELEKRERGGENS